MFSYNAYANASIATECYRDMLYTRGLLKEAARIKGLEVMSRDTALIALDAILSTQPEDPQVQMMREFAHRAITNALE
jgi:hypothetical protein